MDGVINGKMDTLAYARRRREVVAGIMEDVRDGTDSGVDGDKMRWRGCGGRGVVAEGRCPDGGGLRTLGGWVAQGRSSSATAVGLGACLRIIRDETFSPA